MAFDSGLRTPCILIGSENGLVPFRSGKTAFPTAQQPIPSDTATRIHKCRNRPDPKPRLQANHKIRDVNPKTLTPLTQSQCFRLRVRSRRKGGAADHKRRLSESWVAAKRQWFGRVEKTNLCKVQLAILLRSHTSVSSAWIADHLAMGHPGTVSRSVSAGQPTKEILKIRKILEDC